MPKYFEVRANGFMLLITCLFMFGCNREQRTSGSEKGRSHKGLMISLEPVKRQFETGETIKFLMAVVNVSTETIILPDQPWDRQQFPARITLRHDNEPFTQVFERPLRGLEQLTPGQRFQCEGSMSYIGDPVSAVSYFAKLSIAKGPNEYLGWTGTADSTDVSIDVVGQPGAKWKQDTGYTYTNGIGWNNATFCGALEKQ